MLVRILPQAETAIDDEVKTPPSEGKQERMSIELMNEYTVQALLSPRLY